LAILNDVVLNQVLVRFGDSDELTREVITPVQREGTCWLAGTTWQSQAAMRISFRTGRRPPRMWRSRRRRFLRMLEG